MMTTPAAPAATAFSTLVWKVQVPRRISATKPRSNSSKSVVLQPLAEASGGSSASPTLTRAVAPSHCSNRSSSRSEKRRQALAPAVRQESAQAGPAALAPRRRGTRILQSERDSPPLSTSPPHTPRNDRSRGCRRLGCHLSQRRCPATLADAGRHPRLTLRRASGEQKRHQRCFPPWPCGLVGLQQRARQRGQCSSLHERSLTTASKTRQPASLAAARAPRAASRLPRRREA